MSLAAHPQGQMQERIRRLEETPIRSSYAPSTSLNPPEFVLDGRKLAAIQVAYGALLHDSRMNAKRAPLGNYWVYVHKYRGKFARNKGALEVDFNVRKVYFDPKWIRLDGTETRYGLYRKYYINSEGKLIPQPPHVYATGPDQD
jgi:hypothetical protein